MRKQVFAFFLCLLAPKVRASDCSYQLDPEPSPDFLSQLEAKFDAGAAPCNRVLDGRWTMRCYDHWNPNIPHGGLLAFHYAGAAPSDVCAQPDGFQFQKIGTISPQYSDSPNYFDFVDMQLDAWVDQFLDDRWGRYSAPIINGQDFVTWPNWVAVSYHLRQSGNDLLVKTIDEGDYGNPGQTLDLCYAIAPVQTNDDTGQPHSGAPDATMDWAKIDGLFNGGTMPDRAAIEGRWAGRCFLNSDPTRPFASLLAAEDTGLHGDNGPLGSKIFKLNQIIGNSLRMSPDFYDELRFERLEVARRMLSAHAEVASAALPVDGALDSRQIGLECLDYDLRARIAGNFVVARMLEPADAAGVRAVAGVCYYFARTLP